MPSRGSRRPPFPREHGSWAALLVPVLIAMIEMGVAVPGLLLVAAGLALIFARAALQTRAEARPAATVWLAIWLLGAAGLATPLLLRPNGDLLLAIGASAAALEVGANRLGRRTAWRSLVADLLAAAESGLVVPAYAIAVAGLLPPAVMVTGFVVFLFWVQTAMRVRSQLRERTRPAFRWYSLAVHLACLASAAGVAGLAGLALAPPTLHAAYLLVRPPRPEPSLRVGLREIAHAALVVALLGGWGRLL